MMAGRTIVALSLSLLLAAPCGRILAEPPGAKDLEFFEAKVRPILVERCYECHSAAAKKLRGGLMLDSREGWQKGGDTGPAIAPGEPEESLLVQAVLYDDPVLQMPPKGKLSDAEVAILTDWVKRGAPDPRSGVKLLKTSTPRTIDIAAERKVWVYSPLTRPEPPKVTDESWCRTPIDRFILARLEARGIKPNRTAQRRVLIRRAAFDLTGLPPTPEEVEAFVNDPADDGDAAGRLIDRLLASPHYGERWGRHWLDLARYAESHGFEQDYDRPTAYHYRDFVIEALDRDLPYDTFVRWQIAGDELAPGDNLALKATGFLAAGVHSTQITANQVEKERYDELDDLASTIGTAMLGLTIGCARCHDHKYDPIPQKDYYRLISTFTTTVRTEVDLDLDPEGYRTAKAAFDKAHAPYVAALERFEAEQLPGRFERWEDERSAAPDLPAWIVLDLQKPRSKGKAAFQPQADGSVLATGTNADLDTYTFDATLDLERITAIRLEALADPSLVKGGPGRAKNGNFTLTDFRVTARPKASGAKAVAVALKNPRATFEPKDSTVAKAIDDDKTTGWAIVPKLGIDHAAVFETAGEVGTPGGTVLTFTLDFQKGAGQSIGRVRLAVTTAPSPVALDGLAVPQAVAPVLEIPRPERTVPQTATLLEWYRTLDAGWVALKKSADEHDRTAPKPHTVKALISSEGLPAVRLHTQGGDFLEKTHFLKRGDPNQKQDEAAQSFLHVLMKAPDEERHWQTAPPPGWRTSYRRAALARWITDVDQGAGHLLARVIVNRLWQHHLGRGIVATPSDFGAQGEKPTHPELIDWLATELIEGGWHLKPIHKLIMSSAVYQESAASDPARVRLDHDNTLFWRHPPQRLEAEVIRDAMLAVSGLLDPTMGGPGSLDEAQRRRSVYFMIKRSKLIPMMLLFDAPDAVQGVGIRSTTTIAPQSLLLMNSPIVRDWAVGFARRLEPKAHESRVGAVRLGYQIALGRPPQGPEETDALAFLAAQENTYGPDRLEPALADFCQVLMGLNEFIYIE